MSRFIYLDSELEEDSVIRNFRITAKAGKNYNTQHYNLSAINQHLKTIFNDNELQPEATIKKYLIVQIEISRQVTAEIAKTHAESEFEKYRIVQDRLYESDFDKAVKALEKKVKKLSKK